MDTKTVNAVVKSRKSINFLLLGISVIPALLFFQFPVSVYSNGIDPPLAWVFNFLINGNAALGRDIIFPHGPLAFLMYPLPGSGNLWLTIAFHLLLRCFLAFSLLKLASDQKEHHWIIAILATVLLLIVNDLLLTMLQIVILSYVIFFERRNIIWLFPAFILTALAVYVKAFVGITSVVVSATFGAIMIYRVFAGLESRYRLLMFLIIPFFMLLFWVLLYGNTEGLVRYFMGMAQLAGDNSAAVALYPEINWWVTGSAIYIGLILMLINSKRTTLLRFAILTAPALFAIWKYGMARQDFQHASVFFIFVLFILLVYNLLSQKGRALNAIASVAIIYLFYLTLQKSYYYEPFSFSFQGVKSLAVNALHPSYFADTCQQASQKATERNRIDNQLRSIISQATVDVYPWDYTYVPVNNFNWQPRPVLQSYASYTETLDQLNAQHFSGKKAPEFLLWELRKITRDIHAGTLESIDGRYLLNDEPHTLLTLLQNYELAGRQAGIFPVNVYHKRQLPLTHTSKQIFKTSATFNTWIPVPQDTSVIVTASAGLHRNFYGLAKSFLFKDEAVYVYYKLADGDIRFYRIVPKNVIYGLWINPLIMNPEKSLSANRVKEIMFRCAETRLMKTNIEVTFNFLSFYSGEAASGNLVPHVAESFFGVNPDSVSNTLLLSENTFSQTAPYWLAANASDTKTSGSNKALSVKPGGYSVAFEYPLDSLSLSETGKSIIIRTSLWAKAEPGAKAGLVLSIERNGKSVDWKSVDVQNFLHDHSVPNFVTNFLIPDRKVLQQNNLILKAYVWNTGSKDVLIDDFSVRISSW